MEKPILKKVSTYAREKHKAPITIYRWIREGRLKGELIDGVQYVVVEPEKVA